MEAARAVTDRQTVMFYCDISLVTHAVMHSDTDSNYWIKMVYTLVICDLNDTTRMRNTVRYSYTIHSQ